MGVVLENFRMNIFPKNTEKILQPKIRPEILKSNLIICLKTGLKYGTLISKKSDSNKKKFRLDMEGLKKL